MVRPTRENTVFCRNYENKPCAYVGCGACRTCGKGKYDMEGARLSGCACTDGAGNEVSRFTTDPATIADIQEALRCDPRPS